MRAFGDHPTREGIWVPATQVEAREVDAAEQSFGAIPALTHRGVRRKRSDVALTRFQPVTQPEGDRPDCPWVAPKGEEAVSTAWSRLLRASS